MASHPDKPARHICFKKIKVLFKFAWMLCNGNASGSRGGSCKSFIAPKEMSINQLWFSFKTPTRRRWDWTCRHRSITQTQIFTSDTRHQALVKTETHLLVTISLGGRCHSWNAEQEFSEQAWTGRVGEVHQSGEKLRWLFLIYTTACLTRSVRECLIVRLVALLRELFVAL